MDIQFHGEETVRERVTQPVVILCPGVSAQCTVGGKGQLPCIAGGQLGLVKGVCLQPPVYTAPHMISSLVYKISLPGSKAWMGSDRTTSFAYTQPYPVTPRLVSITPALLGSSISPPASTSVTEFYMTDTWRERDRVCLSKHSRQRAYFNPTLPVLQYFMDGPVANGANYMSDIVLCLTHVSSSCPFNDSMKWVVLSLVYVCKNNNNIRSIK